MGTCIRCKKGGAKRPCPAYASKICAACCAKHQRRDIDCPQSCGYLRQTGNKDAYNSAIDKLSSFAMRRWNGVEATFDALDIAPDDVEQWEQPLMIGQLLFGCVDENGDRAIDVMLREHSAELKMLERENLQALQQTAWPSLFEVQDVEIDKGMHLLDCVTQKKLYVTEKLATHSMQKGLTFLSWVGLFDGRLEMVGAVIKVAAMHVEGMLASIRQEIDRHPQKGAADHKVLMREVMVPAQIALRHMFEHAAPLSIKTTDGENINFSEAIFDIVNSSGLHQKLAGHPDMEEHEGSYVWLDHNGRAVLGDGALHLGSITIKNKRLVLETRSSERLERGKALLSTYLQGHIEHRIDAVKDLHAGLAGSQQSPQPQSASIPDDMHAQILGPILQKHMDTWIDERVPALGGQTPRQAVSTKAGRAKVLSMLKEQQRIFEHQPGGHLVDMSWVYAQLGFDGS